MDFAQLVLSADTRGLKTGEDALNSLARTGAKAEAAVGAQAGRMRDAMGRYVKGAQEAESATVKMASGIGTALGRLAAAGAAAFSVRELVNMTNQYTTLTNMLRVASDGQGDVNATLGALADIAKQTRAPLEAMATVYQRASMAADQLGASQSDLMTFTKNIGLALAQQGGSAAAASGALMQLSQTLGAGTVRAEEFNSILEGAFPIAQAAARGIDEAGGSVARLRQLVIEGKISSDEFFNAILSQSSALEASFAQTTPTISQAFGVLTDQLMLTVGAFDQTVGISAAVASAMLLVGDNLERLAIYAGVAASAFAISMAPALLAAAAAAGRLVIGLVATRAALIRTGIGAIVVLVGELAYQFLQVAEKVGGFGNAMSLLKDVAIEAIGRMGAGWDWLKGAAALAANGIQHALIRAAENILIAFQGMINGIAEGLNSAFNLSIPTVNLSSVILAVQDARFETEVAAVGISESMAAASAAFSAPMKSIGALNAALGATGDAAAGSTDAVTGLGTAATEAGGKAAKAAKEAADAMLQKIGGAIDDIAGAFGDWVTSGFKDFQGFMRKIEDTFKQTISDMIATAVSNPIKLALGVTKLDEKGDIVPATSSDGGILSALGGKIGGLGTAFWGGLSGVGSGLLSGGLSGGMSALTGSLAGLSGGGLAGLAGALGALAAPLAAVVGLVSFFTTKTKLLDSGLRVTVHGFDTAVQTFEKIEKSRFWGLSKSVNTKYGAASASVSDPIGAAVGDMQTAVMEAAGVLGIAEAAFDGFSYQLKLSTKGLSKDEAIAKLQTKLEGMGDAFAGMIPGLTELQKEGEGAQDALTRLSQALSTVNLMTDTLGLAFTAVGLTGADVASQLADAFGGLDALTSATTAYYNAFYTDAERAETATRQAAAALAELGAAMPTTRDQYRAMIEAQDLTTEAGRNLFAALVGLSGVMDTVLPKVSNLTAELAALVGTTQTGVDAMISATDTAQSNALAAAKAWYSTAQSLRDFINDLRGTASDLISPAQALANNQARFQMLLAQALAGNKDAADSLTGAASKLLDSTGATARTAFDAARAQARVMSDLQLAAGAADISGGAQDVVADLLGKQGSILRKIRDYLAGGGVLNPDDIDGLNAQLGSLQSAIEAAQATTYAALKARIDVAVDLIETADIPKSLRHMLDSAATGITADLDFIVRAEGVSPAVKFLALNNTSEHISTVEFLAKHPTIPRDVFQLALSTTGNVSKTVNFVVGSDLKEYQKLAALTTASNITHTINAVIPESRRDSRGVRVALAQSAIITKTVDAVLKPGNIGTKKMELALAVSSDLLRTVNVSFGENVTKKARDIALATNGKLVRWVHAEVVNPAGKAARLAMDEHSRLDKNISVDVLRPDGKPAWLAMATISALTKNITAVLQLDKASEDARNVALRSINSLTTTVIAELGSENDKHAQKLALAGATSFTQTISAVKGAQFDENAADLALAVGGLLSRKIAAAFEDDTRDHDPISLALGATADFDTLERTIKAAFGGDNDANAALVALAETGKAGKIIKRTVEALKGKIDDDALKVITGQGTAIKRNVSAINGLINDDAIAAINAVTGAITKTVNAAVDFSKLNVRQKSFLDMITGSAAGTITLGGSFQFDPTTAFKSWYETKTGELIYDPMDALRTGMSDLQTSLSKLAAAIRANTAAIVTPTTPTDPGTGTGGGADNAAALAAAQASGLSILGDRDAAQATYNRLKRQYGTSDAGKGIIRDAYLRLVAMSRSLTEARASVVDLGGVPAFATGGTHAGGLRIVGESGPELEATGPARYYSAPQTRDMMGRNDAALVSELQALRREVAGLREEQRQLGMTTASNTKRTAAIHRKWDSDGMPAVRS